jgi:mycofactocin system creatininase family protein
VRPPTPLADASWPEIEAASRRILVVPLGSLEQHGPHLPLDTDARIAAALTRRLHHLRPDLGLAPVIPYGASGEHADFPGTLSIGTPALTLLVVELVRNAARHWSTVLIVNGHGGNADALRRATDLCTAEGRRLLVHHLQPSSADAHAGRTETSLLLHLDPTAVRLHLARPGITDPLPTMLPRLRADGVRAISPTGVLGDPSGASAAEGADIVGGLLTALLDTVTHATG